jgi:spermidine synthase
MSEHQYRDQSVSFRLRQILSYFYPIVLHKRPGVLSSSLEVTLENGCLVLNSASANYSFGHLHTVFENAFQKYRLENRRPDNALLLGLGGGSVSDILLNDYELDIPIKAIEYDGEIISLYERFFKDDPGGNIEVIHAEAYDYILESSEKFALIVIDLFIDTETPSRFSGERFVFKACSLLKPGGILLINRIGQTPIAVEEKKRILNLMNTLPGKTSETEIALGGMSNYILTYENLKEK